MLYKLCWAIADLLSRASAWFDRKGDQINDREFDLLQERVERMTKEVR